MSNLRRLLGYLRPYRPRVIAAVFFMVVVTLSALPMPRITQYMLDVVLPQKQLEALKWIFWGILALYLGRCIASFLLNYLLGWLGQRFIFDLRFQSYRHLNRLSLSYYDKRQTGKIMARVIDDINIIQYMITGGFVTLITDILTLVVVLPVLFWMDWRLAAMGVVIVPTYVVIYKLFLKRIRRLSELLREKWDALSGALHEKIAGISVVKAFVREDYETERFMLTVQDNFTLGMTQAKINRVLGLCVAVISAGGTGLIYWLGSIYVFRREVQVGELMAFTAYLGYLYGPALRLVDFNIQAQWAGAAIDRVFEVLDTRPEISDSPSSVAIRQMRGEVEFRAVQFGYSAEAPVLRDINLHVQPGEVVAIVGPSGAGKTTLVNLIARFYDVVGGQVLIDGVDVRGIKLESMRRQIGYVSQESLLFSVTLKENIAYGSHDATDEQILQAAHDADLNDVISELPDGIETKIGEDGIKLSVGQKQRLAIARAALTNPRILILDDATSALDSRTEARVQESLERIMKGRTSFIIAHRLSTVVNADRIVVMEGGRIVDVGSHAELVARPGVYRNLYDEQFKSAQEQAFSELLT
ncbi:MAG TPA: ABC transporter ATP-binding protein [Chthonomonadales bacterium]|nr:ABC transporter ATP-binding protein [Chthonomonadales bacterium]